ncbi:ribonuclease inhibitor [uncultured Stenotrophomonas sp.]|uniref:barstar family protein n=1 Tax=uncultured Stenotrophomonas sp. TaxID=165438 RepID=UPI0025FD8CAA|nr:ribonuclease inhibitor [uncultured Stenotrophomonas sp.]
MMDTSDFPAREPSRPLTLQIKGSAIDGIDSLFTELNRVFMASEDWQLGPSLDALDDLLHGGYGALAGHAAVTVIWRDIEHSRSALGQQATVHWLQAKLQAPGHFDNRAISRQLSAVQRGDGQTYFEIVMEIFASHRQITLVPA